MKTKYDSRYTVTREFTGKAAPQFVARFCGERIGDAPTRNEARTLATNHRFDQCAAHGFDLIIAPALDFKLLGTSIQVSTRKRYRASLATNQPDWQKRRAIFADEVLLESGEYFVCR
jgi:hypothetical protein